MKRSVHLYDTVSGRTRTITVKGDATTRVKPRKSEVEVAEPSTAVDAQARRQAVRELTRNSPEQLAHRELLKRMPLQRLITAAIEQGLFDRLKIDG